MEHLVAIPVFNEARYVDAVLSAVRQHTAEILVIDDGSTDGTGERLAALDWIYRIEHPENRGYGQSLIDAFDFADRHGFDWVITMDCDEQHEPSRIPHFIAQAEAGHADIISGSRYLSELTGNSQPPEDRRAINARITAMLNETLGLELTDAFCGFKAYRVEALRRLRLTVPGYAMPMQFWVQAVRAGLALVETPVRLIYKDATRQFGGTLDDPEARFRHYLDVFHAELADDTGFSGVDRPGGCRGAQTQRC